MGQFQCPCCGKDKATVQHVIFECKGCEHTGVAFRVKMAASLDKCSNLLKDPKPDERSEAKENMGETSRLLKNGSGGATEQDLKPLCGLLPRPAKLKAKCIWGIHGRICDNVEPSEGIGGLLEEDMQTPSYVGGGLLGR